MAIFPWLYCCLPLLTHCITCRVEGLLITIYCPVVQPLDILSLWTNSFLQFFSVLLGNEKLLLLFSLIPKFVKCLVPRISDKRLICTTNIYFICTELWGMAAYKGSFGLLKKTKRKCITWSERKQLLFKTCKTLHVHIYKWVSISWKIFYLYPKEGDIWPLPSYGNCHWM